MLHIAFRNGYSSRGGCSHGLLRILFLKKVKYHLVYLEILLSQVKGLNLSELLKIKRLGVNPRTNLQFLNKIL